MALLVNDKDYVALLSSIKRDIASTRAHAVRAVNTDVICMYWRIGRHINEHAEWGDGFINTLSTDVRREFPGIKGFSVRYLKYMAKFARETDGQIVQTLFAQLDWSHNIVLMDKVRDIETRNWYARDAYLSAVDDLIAGPGDNPSVGILLCRGKDNQIAQYALKDINKPIGVSEYRLADILPSDFIETLPSPEDFEGRV